MPLFFFLLPWQNVTCITSCNLRGILAHKSDLGKVHKMTSQFNTHWLEMMNKIWTPQITSDDPLQIKYIFFDDNINACSPSFLYFKGSSCVILKSCVCRRKLVVGLESKDWTVKEQANFECWLSELRSEVTCNLEFSLSEPTPTQRSIFSETDTDSPHNQVHLSFTNPMPLSCSSTWGRRQESRQQTFAFFFFHSVFNHDPTLSNLVTFADRMPTFGKAKWLENRSATTWPSVWHMGDVTRWRHLVSNQGNVGVWGEHQGTQYKLTWPLNCPCHFVLYRFIYLPTVSTIPLLLLHL